MLKRQLAYLWTPILCVLALALGTSLATAQPAKKRELAGSVVDPDGKPIANATIAVSGGGPTAATGPDGSFKLSVAATNLALDVTADGFAASRLQVVGALTPLQVQLVLVRPAAPPTPAPVETRMIGGVVSDLARAPVAGATIKVRGTALQTVSAADGTFALPGVAVAAVVLEIEAPNQPAATVAVPADKGAVAVTLGDAKPAPTSRTIRGKITDPASGEPVVGAQVQVVGTGIVVFSEADGAFAIEGAALGPVQLDVAAPERESKILPVAADTDTIDVALALAKGEQIVIEGRAPLIVKSNLASGASVIDDKDLNRVSAQTLDEAMTAKLSGANLQSNSGAPGGGAQLRLRGISTINGQSSPLYVIDGVIISNVAVPSGANAVTAAAAGGNASSQDNPVNRLADLNPNDIETLEVLKGASAAALYGSKASNGVVVITTKRGRAGENRATVTQRFGVAQVAKTLGSRTYGSLQEVKDSFCAPTDSAEKCNASPFVVAYNANGGKVFDHEAELERTTFARETLASASGGFDNGNYFASGLLTDTPGVLKGTYYEKQSARLAIGYRFSDRVRVGVTANLIHSVSDRGLTNNDNTNTSNFVALAGTPSFLDLRPVGGLYPSNPGAGGAGTNPLQTVDLLQNREEIARLIAGTNLAVEAYQGANGRSKVRLLGNFGADLFSQKNNLVSPNSLVFEPKDGLPGTLVDASTKNLNWNLGAGAIWTYRPEDGAFQSALSGGVTYESVDLKSVYAIAQNLNAGQPSVDSATSVNTNELNLRTKDAGLYLQEELALLDNRLSVLGGLLAERSSLNGDTEKYFLYPKVAAVYSVVSSDKGPSSLAPHFESLRVRGAYGEAGNRPNYGNKFTALNSKVNIDGEAGLPLSNTLGYKNIEPERQREFELGIDLATKDQRVALELTGYQRSISNLILQRALPTSTGFTTQFSNGGALRNRGLEAAVSVRPLPTKRVDWTSRATFTLNRSTITELPGHLPFDITAAGFGTGLGAFRIEEGKSATQIVSTVDADGNEQVAGDGEPSFRVGWANLVTAGDFTFSALLDWQHGSNVINLTRLLYDGAGNSPDVEAASARFKAFRAGDPRSYIEDASFVKLREVSVTYALPKRLLSELGPLKSLQVGLSGRNLLTFTGYTGFDPEVSNFGGQPVGRNYDVAPYPPSRSFWLSITAGI